MSRQLDLYEVELATPDKYVAKVAAHDRESAIRKAIEGYRQFRKLPTSHAIMHRRVALLASAVGQTDGRGPMRTF